MTPAVVNDGPPMDREYTIEANRVGMIPISVAYMNTLSETKRGYGIAVEAPSPISVSTLQQWNGNGEVARHLPVEAWGSTYYTMNFYQDRYGTQAAGYDYRPSQIVIVAANDSTVVTYTPTVDTEGGISKGTSASVTLNRGECYMIKAKIDESLNRKWETDLSGTLIRSTNPVAVISGHTKVGILRYPDIITGLGGSSPAHFLRNNVHDVMFPVEFAGTRFVTVPCKYTGTRITGKASPEFGVEDDRGDVIRVVALEDNTVVKTMNQSGSEFAIQMTLNKGQTQIVPSLETPTYWETDKPVLMAQYGKSYAKDRGIARTLKAEDSPLGHPSVEAGMPMMQCVPPIDRFVNYGAFSSPDGMDNFINIVFRADEIAKIKYNGRTLNSAFGGSMRLIKGTPYACISTQVGTGEQWIESVDSNVRWCAWNYGSLDGLSQGRAYGTPVAVDVTIPCDDSLALTQTTKCGDVDGRGIVLLPNQTTCGSIYHIYPVQINNYTFDYDTASSTDRSTSFSLKVKDKNQAGSATIRLVSRSGKFIERTYVYDPVKIVPSVNSIDFGLLSVGKPATISVSIRNANTQKAVTITKLLFPLRSDVFRCTPDTGIVLSAGDSTVVEVTVNVPVGELVADTLVAEQECGSIKLLPIRVRGILTSVNEEQHHGQILRIDPNPSNDIIDINLNIQSPGTLSISTLDGRQVFSQTIEGQMKQLHIDLSHLSTGVYIVTLSSLHALISKPLYKL